jgi:hypothetical protein
MTETLTGPDGQAVALDDLERQFHATMAAPEQTEPVAPAPQRVDHEAPYGRKADGTPRQKPAGPGRPAKARTQSKPASDKGKTPETPQDVSDRRTAGVESLVNVGAALCLGISVRGGDAFKADAVTLSASAKPLAQACTAVAEQDPRFARILDKITASGPYAALAATAVPIVAQLAMNHGVTAMRALNAVPPEELLRQLDEVPPDAGSDSPAG